MNSLFKVRYVLAEEESIAFPAGTVYTYIVTDVKFREDEVILVKVGGSIQKLDANNLSELHIEPFFGGRNE
jgi:hypothetical protein